MSRRSKRARLGNVKRNINIVLATIYLLLSGFLLFLIFKHNILAFGTSISLRRFLFLFLL